MDPQQAHKEPPGRVARWFSALLARSRGDVKPEDLPLTSDTTAPGEPTLSDMLQRRHSAIVDDWERAVRAIPAGKNLSRPVLIDHVPDLLKQIAKMTEDLGAGRPPTPPVETARAHAYQRLDVGFDLAAVVAEYTALRATITRHLFQECDATAATCSPHVLLVLNQAIDTAVSASVERYTFARDRTLGAIDRIATASLESKNIDDLLERLLRVFVETTASVDTVAIFLRDGDEYRARAAIGLEQEVVEGYSLRYGQGFVGTIAATGAPKAIMNAAEDSLVLSKILHAKGIRALYGVPMRNGGEIIGVAHMGSTTAYLFSDEDKHLFSVLVSRATAAVVQSLLQQTLEAERQGLRDALRAREQLMEIVSHDLRNPLNAMSMGLELLARKAPTGEDGQETRSRVAMILKHARGMSRLISDLVDLGSLETNRVSVASRSEDPEKLLRQALSGFESDALEAGIALHHEISGARRVLCDRDRMQQVFGNLIGNAIKATSAGGEIHVRVDAREDPVRFSVSDTGCGIPEEDLPHVFEPYWRGDAPGYRGRGLGLAIAHGLLSAQGGRLWAESERGKGTTFFFTLPAAPAASEGADGER